MLAYDAAVAELKNSRLSGISFPIVHALHRIARDVSTDVCFLSVFFGGLCSDSVPSASRKYRNSSTHWLKLLTSHRRFLLSSTPEPIFSMLHDLRGSMLACTSVIVSPGKLCNSESRSLLGLVPLLKSSTGTYLRKLCRPVLLMRV